MRDRMKVPVPRATSSPLASTICESATSTRRRPLIHLPSARALPAFIGRVSSRLKAVVSRNMSVIMMLAHKKAASSDRKRVVSDTSVAVRVDLGGGRTNQKQTIYDIIASPLNQN